MVNKYDAPDGCIAVKQRTPNSCKGCSLDRNLRCMDEGFIPRCTRGYREDKSNVIFKKLKFHTIRNATPVMIPDANVRLIWWCENDKCKLYHKCFDFTPDWFQDNGNPVCECGHEMYYVRTIVEL